MIQSEDYTWPAFVAGAKSVTRRDWKPQTAAHYVQGFVFDCWSNSPYAGGVKIGQARVTQTAHRENRRHCPDADYAGEGFAWMNAHPQAIPIGARKQVWAKDDCSLAAFGRWRKTGLTLWAVRFEIVSIEDSAVERLEEILSQGVT